MIVLEKINAAAINFVSDFINDNWLEQEDYIWKYQNIGYSQVKNPANVFRGFFVDDQNAKCCYCCRNIFNNTTTELEHIIPSAKSELADFKPYYDLSVILRENVIPQSVFENSDTEILSPPFPHHIAYQNIVASCNGRTFESSENFTCCNRERKDDFVPPFNVMPESIEYLLDGTIVYLNDLENREYFSILNLDKEILNKIRRLWFLFSKSELTLENVLDDTILLKEKLVNYAIANSVTVAEDIKLLETFSNINLWDTFKEYSFFFEYYKSQI